MTTKSGDFEWLVELLNLVAARRGNLRVGVPRVSHLSQLGNEHRDSRDTPRDYVTRTAPLLIAVSSPVALLKDLKGIAHIIPKQDVEGNYHFILSLPRTDLEQNRLRNSIT